MPRRALEVVSRFSRAGQPVRERAAVAGDLDVVAGDAAEIVLTGPADGEALAVLSCRDVLDADLRRGLVVQELGRDEVAHLRVAGVVSERPDSGATQIPVVDHVVLRGQRLSVVVVQLAPDRDRDGGAGQLVRGPRGLLDRVVIPPVRGRK